MEQTKSMSETLYSIPKMAVDYATFIGVGLLTKSYSAIWVNDPTTKSGIILAGLLNATAIGFATNYLANEETPVHYKVLLSIAALSITIFATPYLTILLKDKFMIIITREAAIQIGSLHLATKGLTSLASKAYTSGLSYLRSRATSQLTSAYESFKTPDGLQKWMTLSDKDRLNYLNKFFDANLSFFSFDGETIKNMFFSRYPAVIENYTKEQATWLHAFLLSKEGELNLTPDVAEAYATLFSSKELPIIPYLSTIARPAPQPMETINVEAIGNLDLEQATEYKVYTTEGNHWTLFSREQQIALNDKFDEFGMETNVLTPLPGDFVDDFDSSLYSSERLNNWVDPTSTISNTYKEIIYFSNDPIVILQYDPQEAKKIHALFSASNEAPDLSQEALQAYIKLFTYYHLLLPTNLIMLIPKHQLVQSLTVVEEIEIVPQPEADFSRDPQIINQYNQDKAKQVHAFFSTAEEELDLSEDAEQAYVELFYKYDLLPVNDIAEKPRIVPRRLEVPHDYSKLTHAQAAWYYIWMKNDGKTLSLAGQFNLNKSLEKHLNKTFYLVPQTEEDINNASPKIINELVEKYKESPEDLADECDAPMQSALFTKFYWFFQTDEGPELWEKHDDDLRLMYLNKFFEMGLPFVRFDNDLLCKKRGFDKDILKRISFSQDPKIIETYSANQAAWILNYLSSDEPLELKESVVDAYVTLIHKVELPIKNIYDMLQSKNGKEVWKKEGSALRRGQLEQFFAAHLAYFSCEKEDLRGIDIPKTEHDIQGFTKDQSDWLYNHFLSSGDPISPGISQACVDLFYKNGHPPLPQIDGKERILPENFELDSPEKYVERPLIKMSTAQALEYTQLPVCKKITQAQACWYSLYFGTNVERWKIYSLEMQDEMNEKFKEFNLSLIPLIPSSENEIKNAPLSIIKQLEVLYSDVDTFIELEEPLQQSLTLRFYEFYKTSSGQEVWKIRESQSRAFHLNSFFCSDLAFFDFPFSKEDLKAMDIPKTPEKIQGFTKNQSDWLYNHFLSSEDPISPGISQACVDLFYKNALSPFPKMNEKILSENFKLAPPIDCKKLSNSQACWYKHYIGMDAIRWKSFSLELQNDLNEKFKSAGVHINILLPSTVEDIKKTPLSIIAKFQAKYTKKPEKFSNECDELMQRALNQRFYEFFQTEDGRDVWVALKEPRRAYYLNLFFEMDLEFPSFYGDTFTIIQGFDNAIFTTMLIASEPDDIEKYSKNRAGWAHNILLAKNPTLTRNNTSAYIHLFYKNDLPPLPQQIISHKYIEFPPFENCLEVRNLTKNQVLWHKICFRRPKDPLPEWVYSFDLKCEEYGIQGLALQNLQKKQVEDFSNDFILQLGYHIRKGFNKSTNTCTASIGQDLQSDLRKVLNTRLHTIFQAAEGNKEWKALTSQEQDRYNFEFSQIGLNTLEK